MAVDTYGHATSFETCDQAMAYPGSISIEKNNERRYERTRDGWLFVGEAELTRQRERLVGLLATKAKGTK